jgi:hypothetical protein
MRILTTTPQKQKRKLWNSQCWIEFEYEESNDHPSETEDGTYRTLIYGLSVSVRILTTTPQKQKRELKEFSVMD